MPADRTAWLSASCGPSSAMTVFMIIPPNIKSGMKHSSRAKRLPKSIIPWLHSATMSLADTPAASFSRTNC